MFGDFEIIDAQVHSWEAAPGNGRPWDSAWDYGSKPEDAFTTEAMLVAMDAVGIDGAVLSLPPSYRTVLPNGVSRYDNTYAEEAAALHPSRIASAARYDHLDPQVADLVGSTRSRPGTLAVRVVIISEQDWSDYERGGYEVLLGACEEHSVPVMLFVSRRPDAAGPIAAAHPDLQLVVDHFGLPQPPHMAADPEPWERLPGLLEVAKFPNVAVKFSGAPTLSAGRYPFSDLWPHLHQVLDAFGVDRLMWGSDVTRVKGLHTWAEAVDFVRYTDELSNHEKAALMGGTLRRLLCWGAAG